MLETAYTSTTLDKNYLTSKSFAKTPNSVFDSVTAKTNVNAEVEAGTVSEARTAAEAEVEAAGGAEFWSCSCS